MTRNYAEGFTLGVLAALLVILAFGWYRHYEKHAVHWVDGIPYCSDGSVAIADEDAAAHGERNVARCE